jgi:2,4-dienoyl-CoA reductase-like NADH-dependent reductase (Old Yellow Enzyme family)
MPPKLFQPIQLGELRLDNRIVIAPMCQYSALDGAATNWHLIHLGHLALSGAALLIIEATAVQPEGRISPGDLGLWSDETEGALARVVAAVREHSEMPLGIQLAHAGRKSSSRRPWEGGAQIPIGEGGWLASAPSPLPHKAGEEPPAALSRAGLSDVREAFVASAMRAVRIGLDLIEIHAAHGYLLHEFLSPLSNRRDDEFGGSLENRMRFPLSIFEAVRAAVPVSIPVGMRVSATDWVKGGWDLEQTLAFARALEAKGCSFIHVSSGGVSPAQSIPIGPNYQVPFAARIRQEAGLLTGAVGMITEPEQADEIVRSGAADLVLLGRELLRDPSWPLSAAKALGQAAPIPPAYARAY